MPLPCCGEQLAVDARLLEEAVAPGAGGEPEQVVHALGGLREQRHVGVGAAAGDVVGAAVVEVDALALEAGDVGGEVGLDADDRLDPGRLGLRVELVGAEHVAVVGHRDRGHARARRCARSARRAGPRRRAWSTRCARAGGRRSPGSRWSTCGRGAPRSVGWRGVRQRPWRRRGEAARRPAGGRSSAYANRRSASCQRRTDRSVGPAPGALGQSALDAAASRLSVMIACMIRAEPVGAERGGARRHRARRSRARGRVAAAVPLLCAWTARGQRGAPGQQVAELRRRPRRSGRAGSASGSLPRPGHPDVGGASPRCAEPSVRSSVDQAVARVEARAPGRWSRRPTGRTRPGAAP